jgi:hypothetical protein
LLVATFSVTANAKSKSKKAKAATPAASTSSRGSSSSAASRSVDHLTPLVLPFEAGQVLSASQAASLTSGIEGWNCGSSCVLTALKVQNRTPKYAAVLLRQEETSAQVQKNATWILSFDDQGRRQGAKVLEARESLADGHISGVRGSFESADRFSTQTWSAYDPAHKDPALNEGTSEHWKIADDGRLIEDAAAK